jgi:hypothetical protein
VGSRGLIFLSTTLQLKLGGRAELLSLEGMVQALFSVRVTAGRGRGGGMLAMLVVFVHLFMSLLQFLPHLLVPWAYHAWSQGIHGTHARWRWWVWMMMGT